MNKKYDENKIIELYNKGLSDKEIADYFHVTEDAFACKRRKMGLKAHTKALREDYKPTRREIAIIIGTVLGDSTIRYVHDKCKYPNLTYVHSPKQKEYSNYLASKLSNFKASYKEYDDNNPLNKLHKKLCFTGRNMKCLVPLQRLFYINGTKIIPMKLINKFFTSESIYYWFMDDGSYDKTSNSYIINTQCFSKENLEEFCNFLLKRFGLQFNIKSDNCLYLKHESNNKMKAILKNYNKCESMCYKYGESRL